MPLAIVTGSSAGLGFQIAKLLADQGFDRIVVTSRYFEKAKLSSQRLAALRPGTEYIPHELKLHDLDATKKFAEAVVSSEGSWNLLINNAGAKIERPTKLTKQGFEWHYGVNHLAHFALTSWLSKKAADSARVVSNASIAASKGDSNLWLDATGASPSQQYCASKLANLCFALELSSRSPLISTAAHPGFARAEPYGNLLVRTAEYLFAQSAARGALPLVRACLSDAPAGNYYGPRHFELWGSPKLIEPTTAATQANREMLWKLSEEQLGFKF